MKVRRIKTLKSVQNIFYKDIELIEYYDNLGIFYQKGYPKEDKSGLDFKLICKFVKDWYEELESIDHTKTSHYTVMSKLYMLELSKIKTDLRILNHRRYELNKLLGINSDAHISVIN